MAVSTTSTHIVRELLRAIPLVLLMARRAIQERYRGSTLGVFWTLLNPMALLATYTLVFAVYARVDVPNGPYTIFLFTGLLPWLWLSQSAPAAATAIIRQPELVTRCYFPPQILPTVRVIADLADFVLALPVLLVALWWVGRLPGLGLVALPLIILLQAMFLVGLALALSALTVFYRDVQFIISSGLSFWMFLTPGIFYDRERPFALAAVLQRNFGWTIDGSIFVLLSSYLNPMAPFIASYQHIFNDPEQIWPALSDLLAAAVHGVLSLLLGLAIFARCRYAMIEEL
jgi:ABC-type polysaccharide/polyol phosphate export permease